MKDFNYFKNELNKCINLSDNDFYNFDWLNFNINMTNILLYLKPNLTKDNIYEIDYLIGNILEKSFELDNYDDIIMNKIEFVLSNFMKILNL